VTLITLAEARRFRNHPSLPRWAGYGCVLVLGYLTHLTSVAFSTVLIDATALFRLYHRRDASPSAELWLVLPCLALLAFYFGIAMQYRQPGDLVENPYLWRPVLTKVVNFAGELYRYGARTDGALFLLLVACVAIYVGRLRNWQRDAVTESVILAALMLILYVALPRGYSEAYFVDVRALPFATLFALLALIQAESSNPLELTGRPVLGVALAVVLATINLIYLGTHFAAQSHWLSDYRAVVARVPERSRVLSIYTRIADGRVFPFRHAFAFALLDRDALVPYLQTGDTGNGQKYIRYVHRPYAPWENWYNEPHTGLVDWPRIGCEYNFILASQPFDTRQLGLHKARLVVQNASAALFALPPIDPAACAR
jgi:hypothetical protein